MYKWVVLWNRTIVYLDELTGEYKYYLDDGLYFWREEEGYGLVYLSSYFEDPMNPTLEELVMFDLEFSCDIMSGIELIQKMIKVDVI